ncbi:hypothetical protein [Sinorhizobium fredii]|uniref:hypothetical protein n=1 Tax=Rhizobium fredii TaxID=380 RepID=UPI00055D48D7
MLFVACAADGPDTRGGAARAQAIVDGEELVLDDHVRSDFGKLQRGRPLTGHFTTGEILLCAFDLLCLNGRDLRGC